MTPSIRAYCRRHRIAAHPHGTLYVKRCRTLRASPIGWILAEYHAPRVCNATGLDTGDVDRILGCHETLQDGLQALAGVHTSAHHNEVPCTI